MEIRFSEGGFCVAAHANGISEDRIERALEDNDLSRDPAFQSKLPTTGELWRRQEMGRAISIGASSPVVVLPCGIVIDCSSF